VLSSQPNHMTAEQTADQAHAPSPNWADVLIAGANYTGLLAALCLAKTVGDDVRIAVFDHKSPIDRMDDPRCFALSAGSRNVLKRLGVWDGLRDDAQDVTGIAITDSPLEAAVRPVLLRYDNRLDDGTPAASIVPGARLLAALAQATDERPGITIVGRFELEAVNLEPGSVRIRDAGGRQWRGSLLVAADGRASRVRDLSGIKVDRFSHQQTGIVTIIQHSLPHDGCAIQHFLPGGPFAILPLPGNRSCITWSEEKHEAQRVLALGDDSFLDEIDRRIAGQLGNLTLHGERAAFPLSTQMARSFIAPRTALVGDAAHGVHPIAGQGLNLAMRDVAALAEQIADAARIGLDFGDQTALEAYERWRRFDSTLSAGVFDTLNRLFSKDITLLRSAREIGLAVVDRISALKKQLVQEAAGLSGEIPELMKPF
jgi:2-octaprenyl-6-methoxyphenol hydroxylase